jgi:hypothetical protein
MTAKPVGISRRQKTTKLRKPIDKGMSVNTASRNRASDNLVDRVGHLEELMGSHGLGLYLSYASDDEKLDKQQGRPTLSESHLIGRRNEFEAISGEFWAVLGPNLEAARKKNDVEHLRKAFDTAIPAQQRSLFTLFLHKSSNQASAKSVREAFKARENAIKKTRQAESERDSAFWRLQQAIAALREVDPLFRKALDDYLRVNSERNSGIPESPGWKFAIDPVREVIEEYRSKAGQNSAEPLQRGGPTAIRRELGKRGHELNLLDFGLETARVEQKDIEELCDDKAASYSKAELLKFLNDERYECNPHNLASAVAGLPHLGCRQSYERCQRNLLGSAPHIHFRTFKLIERACKKSRSQQSLLASLLHSIEALPKADADLKSFLTRKWPDLKRTVPKISPFRRFEPHEIARTLIEAMEKPKTPAEILLAEQDQMPAKEKPVR